MKIRFSIRYKILSVVTALLVCAIGLYLALATRIFQQDKSELVYDLNKSMVTTLGTELETVLRGASDKLRLFAFIFAGKGDAAAKNAFREITTNDPLLIRMELYGAKNEVLDKITEPNFSELYGATDKYFEETLIAQREVPFDEIKTKGFGVWNATIENGPALLGMGVSVIIESNRGRAEKNMSVVGYVKADGFLKNLRSSQLTQAFIVDSKGFVLIHPVMDVMTQKKNFEDLAIVKQLRASVVSTGVSQYTDSQNEEQLGAYTKVNLGTLGVVSQVPSRKAFLAVENLIKRSLMFALIVTTVTFISTIFLSRTLTHPLYKLMSAMERVAEGHLDTELKIRSRDEIAVLSQSFNQMTHDLKSSRGQLEEINRELENKVIDRTKKLEEQNRAVKEAQEALLRTTRLASVGEIAGRTAHEVLNPLTSIMNRIQKVQRRLNEDVVNHKNLLGEIVSAWKTDINEKGLKGFLNSLNEPSQIDPKMTLIEEDFMNIGNVFKHWDQDLNTLESDTKFLLQQTSRIEKILGQMRSLTAVSGKHTQLKTHKVLHEAVNVVADLFDKHKIKIQEKFEATNDDVLLDHDEFIQVMTNLMRNSLHAVNDAKHEAKQGYVTVETRNVDNKIVIDIVDNGIGISEDNTSKLFESQFTTKSPELGTGLGLSISRRFIRAFHGDLFLVSSQSKKETRFRIELPIAQKRDQVVAA